MTLPQDFGRLKGAGRRVGISQATACAWKKKDAARIYKELLFSALLMALWRRQPKGTLCCPHSDQGCKFTSHDWRDFLKASNFAASMSRWGDCNENAAVEGFLQILKPQRIKRKTYDSREEAKADVFDHIEMFQNHVRRHGNNDRLSPVKIERQYFDRQAGV